MVRWEIKRSAESMSVKDRNRWDELYRQAANKPFPAPDPLLKEAVPPVNKSVVSKPRALDLAGGMGQNALWLAGQGYNVDLIDISRIGLSRARVEMGLRNLRNVNLLQRDLDTLELVSKRYDVIAVFRYLKRSLFPTIKSATKPGGYLVYETFNTRYLAQVPGFNPDFLLEIGELEATFREWEIRSYEEVDHRAQLVAVRPR